jgi:hypothetical protein
MPRFVKLRRKNDLTDGVFPYSKNPADDKPHEDAKTRSTEANLEAILVNPKWIWYVSFNLGVPPPHLFFSRNWVCAERLGFSSRI